MAKNEKSWKWTGLCGCFSFFILVGSAFGEQIDFRGPLAPGIRNAQSGYLKFLRSWERPALARAQKPPAVTIEGQVQNVKPIISPAYTVIVDYGKSYQDLIFSGSYDFYDPEIKNFSKSQANFGWFYDGRNMSKETRISIVSFEFDGLGLTTRQVNDGLEGAGYRPANFFELITLGVKFPDLVKEYWVVALGSSMISGTGNRRVLYFSYGDKFPFGLRLHPTSGLWGQLASDDIGDRQRWGFAAVRK